MRISDWSSDVCSSDLLAAIEAEWETHPAPAGFTLFGLPNQQEMRTDYEVKIPYALGLIATRSLDEEIKGIKQLVAEHELRIRNGMLAYERLQVLRSGDKSADAIAAFNTVKIGKAPWRERGCKDV